MNNRRFVVAGLLTIIAPAIYAQDVSEQTAPEPQQLRVEQQWSQTLPQENLRGPRATQPGQVRPGYGPGYQPGNQPGYGPGYQPGYGPQAPYFPPPSAYYGSTTYRYEPTGPYQYWRRPGWDFTRPLPGGTYGRRPPTRPITFPCLEGKPCNQ
jgi:hypothetical protein